MGTDGAARTQRRQVLATDLDGTLIPLDGDGRQAADLRVLEAALERSGAMLAFVTGRHLASVRRAMTDFALPKPDVAICNVGTSMYRWSGGAEPEHIESYSNHLRERIAQAPITEMRRRLAPIRGLTIQEEEKLSDFKLSYYTEAAELEAAAQRVLEAIDRDSAPYSLIHSLDPAKGRGLIDVLPRGVTKAYALRWWAEEVGLSGDEIVFAGDSGNDLAALTGGYRAIVVNNASGTLADQVAEAHRRAGWTDRLYRSKGAATSGVLEGARHFRVIGPD